MKETIRGIPGRVALRRNNGVVIIARDKGLLVETVQPEDGGILKAQDYFKKLGADLT